MNRDVIRPGVVEAVGDAMDAADARLQGRPMTLCRDRDGVQQGAPMPVNLGDYAQPLAREPRHVHVPAGLCRVRCKGCSTVWWSPRPLDSLRSHWVIRHAEEAAPAEDPEPLHPCGVAGCCQCADAWLLRLWGMTWDQIDARLGVRKGTTRRHTSHHRGFVDPGQTERRQAA